MEEHYQVDEDMSDVTDFLDEIMQEKREVKKRKTKRKNVLRAKEEERYLIPFDIVFQTLTYYLHSSEKQLLDVIKGQGWESISCQPLQLDIDNLPVTLKGFSTRTDYQELQVLKRFISDKFLNDHLLPALNSNLETSREKLKSNKRYHNAVDISTWWKWFTRYLLEHEIRRGKIKKDLSKWDDIRKTIINKNRYSAILWAHDVGLAQLENIFQALRIQIQLNFTFGTIITVDERVISYNGEDMKVEGINVNIPGKPYPSGLLEYIAAQLLPRSGIQIMIDFEPRIPGNKLTPKEALLSLTNKIETIRKKKCHLICDSAFTAARSLSEFDNIPSVLTIAISSSSACGLQHLYQLAVRDLPTFKSRTFRSTTHIVQVLQKKNRIMAVATNAWTVEDNHQEAPSPRLSYNTAVSMLKHDSASAIISAFNLPPGTNRGDIVGIIKTATGHDISMPCPDSRGMVRLTKETIKKMKAVQVKILFDRTPRCKGKKKRKRDEMIQMILSNHPKARRHAKKEDDPRNIKAKIDDLLLPIDDKSPIVDHYSDYYGEVDHLNRAYYQHFNPAFHRAWKKLFLLSEVYSMVMNAWGAYEENKLHRATIRRRGKVKVDRMARRSTLTSFILNVCQQVVD